MGWRVGGELALLPGLCLSSLALWLAGTDRKIGKGQSLPGETLWTIPLISGRLTAPTHLASTIAFRIHNMAGESSSAGDNRRNVCATSGRSKTVR